MSDAYSEYPITLSHPHFKPSVPVPVPGTEIYDRQGKLVRQDYRGTPQQLPPVTARDENEEEYYKAQGYERAGKVDPSAWVRAHSDAPSIDYVPQKYPMWRNGQLIMTAQEDPGATEEDLAPKGAAQSEITPQPAASEAENLRAQMEEMNRQMSAMSARMQEQAAENAALKAQQDPEVAEGEPRAKRPYNRKVA